MDTLRKRIQFIFSRKNRIKTTEMRSFLFGEQYRSGYRHSREPDACMRCHSRGAINRHSRSAGDLKAE